MNQILMSLQISISVLIYLCPGIIISHHIVPNNLLKDIINKLYIYVIISFSFSTLLGLIIMKFYLVILTKIIYAITLIYIIYSFGKKHNIFKNLFNIELNQIQIILLPLFIMGFYLLINKECFPRGWDASNHYVMFRQFLLNGPAHTEIGSLIKSYYPRGFSSSVSIFSSIMNLDPNISFKIFSSIIISTFPIAIYVFTKNIFNNNVAFFSSFSSLTTGYLFLPRGNFPFLLSLYYMGILLILMNLIINYSINYFKYICFSWLILTSILFTHPSILVLYIITIISSLMYGLVMNRTGQILKYYKNIIYINIVSTILSIIFFICIQPKLFIGYIEFLNLHEVKSEVLKQIIFRTTNKEMFIIFFTPYLIFPFIIGLFEIIKKDSIKEIYIGSLLTSTICLFTFIIRPNNAREIYYMLYPFFSAIGVGIDHLFNEHNNLFKVNNNKIFSKIIIILLMILSISNLYHSSNGIFINKPIYLSERDIEFADFINKNFRNERIAALNNPNMNFLDVLTTNKFILGDNTISDQKSYRDIYNVFSFNANYSKVIEIIQIYNITAIIIDNLKYSGMRVLDINETFNLITYSHNDFLFIQIKERNIIE